jgi:two-component system, NarL family, response regulator DevR
MESPSPNSDASASIRVLLVDEQRIFTSSLRTALELGDDVAVVGEAETERGCIEAVTATCPDVVVMDVHLGNGPAIGAIEEIASMGARVVVLTTDDDDETLRAAIRAGASGYLLKRSRVDEVARAIRLTAEGKSVIDPSMAAALLEIPDGAVPDPFDGLTPRERRVLAGVATGMTNVEIARQMHFSERTIKNVVSHAMTKIGARRRSEAAALFATHAGTDPPPSLARRSRS